LVRCAVNVDPSERITVCGYRAGTGAGMEGDGRRCDFVGQGLVDRYRVWSAQGQLGPGREARSVRSAFGRDIVGNVSIVYGLSSYVMLCSGADDDGRLYYGAIDAAATLRL
jgi:hypothetical protein